MRVDKIDNIFDPQKSKIIVFFSVFINAVTVSEKF